MGTAVRHWEGLTYLGLGRAPHPVGGLLLSVQLEGKEEAWLHSDPDDSFTFCHPPTSAPPTQGHRWTSRGCSHCVWAHQFPDAGTSRAEASLMPLGLPKATWVSKHLAGLWARVRLVGGMGRTQGCPQLRASSSWRRARQPPKWLCTQARGGHGAQRVGSLGLSRRSR